MKLKSFVLLGNAGNESGQRIWRFHQMKSISGIHALKRKKYDHEDHHAPAHSASLLPPPVRQWQGSF
jgi:hypothetical protein